MTRSAPSQTTALRACAREITMMRKVTALALATATAALLTLTGCLTNDFSQGMADARYRAATGQSTVRTHCIGGSCTTPQGNLVPDTRYNPCPYGSQPVMVDRDGVTKRGYNPARPVCASVFNGVAPAPIR